MDVQREVIDRSKCGKITCTYPSCNCERQEEVDLSKKYPNLLKQISILLVMATILVMIWFATK